MLLAEPAAVLLSEASLAETRLLSEASGWLGASCSVVQNHSMIALSLAVSRVAQSAVRTQPFEQCSAHQHPPVFGCSVFKKKCLFVIVLPP